MAPANASHGFSQAWWTTSTSPCQTLSIPRRPTDGLFGALSGNPGMSLGELSSWSGGRSDAFPDLGDQRGRCDRVGAALLARAWTEWGSPHRGGDTFAGG